MGMITNIQRFSLTDGDGIRTTVFFKGCNMKCTWCHNPETIGRAQELLFYRTKCIGCGKCFEACPTGAQRNTNGVHTIDRALCASCGKCADVCYAEALTMCGKEMSVEDVIREVRQDVAYYKSSGGGVTLSGGEVFMQRDFAVALADAANAEGISVAIETNLSFPFAYMRPLLTKCAHIMCDVKLYEGEVHEKWTGIPNAEILENVRQLDTLDIPFTVRTPLIPGVTDTVKNITAVAGLIKDMKNLVRYELLNFNPLGEGKYTALDKENTHGTARPLGADRISVLKSALDGVGIAYKII